ncbi:branched-chain amino acid aminotransferase II [Aspergillus spinulosporus]
MSAESFLPPSVLRLTDGQPFLAGPNPLDSSKLRITLTKCPKPVPALDDPDLISQKVFTDHMVWARWTASSGWDAPEIRPHGPLSLPPSASVLHYATACFEGMKAYRGYDGKLRLFRPLYNCERMLASAARAALPAFEPKQLLELIRRLCALEGPKWLPSDRKGSSLYIRPTLVGVDDNLGFRAPQEAVLFIIVSYWPDAKPSGQRLLASESDTIRAWPGGSGSAKLAANYGPSILAHAQAKRKGYDQILWLFGADRQITEAGSTNIFVIWRTSNGRLQLVTPALDDHTILAGLTRKSVLELSRERLLDPAIQQDGVEPVETLEQAITIHDVIRAADEGRLHSVFVVGTAASIVPVREIRFYERTVQVDTSLSLHMTLLQQWMDEIRYGVQPSTWADVVEE